MEELEQEYNELLDLYIESLFEIQELKEIIYKFNNKKDLNVYLLRVSRNKMDVVMNIVIQQFRGE